jgi:Fe-S-cluster containining protein
VSEVSCQGCTACCRQQIVVLSKADEPNLAAYDYREVGSLRVLNTRPDGACIHLGASGCTIYDRRPIICQHYDCRKHFQSLSAGERKRFAGGAMGEAARKRLASLDAGDFAGLDDYRSRAGALRSI